MSGVRVVVAGAGGRMGRALIAAVHAAADMTVAAAIERPEAGLAGRDAGELAGVGAMGVVVTGDALEAVLHADAIVDFTAPANTVALAALAAQARIVHVVGTTGLAPADIAKIEAAARHAVVVRSGNMSVGVNLLAGLVRKVAATLDATFDVEIVEMHHRMKVDAPSGTALMLGEAAAAGRGVDLPDHALRGRDGHTGPRPDGAIGFASLRGGSVVGEHAVIFAGPSERIELVHKAEDRAIFANGALRAARWGQGRKPGAYTMADVLGLS